MRRFRILLAEDDAVISGLVVEILAELGHDVRGIARTESEAIDAATRQSPDLMIVDAYLPVGSGVSAMDTILRHTDMPDIFMTGGSRWIIPPQATLSCKRFGTAGLTVALDHVAGRIAALAGGDEQHAPITGLCTLD